jgi:hypothetical protein
MRKPKATPRPIMEAPDLMRVSGSEFVVVTMALSTRRGKKYFCVVTRA